MVVWNNLCDEITNDEKDNLHESDFQKRISLFIQGALFWSSFTDNLREQYKIEFAHTKGFTDIVLLKDGQLQVIIELKKPNHVQDADNIRQLTDYMKVKRCPYGIYIGEKLDLFFDELNELEPVLVISIAFTKDNEAGKELLDLLKYVNFSSEAFMAYCKKQLQLHRAAQHWISQQGKDELYHFMLEKAELQNDDFEAFKKIQGLNVIDLSAIQDKKETTRGRKNENNSHQAKPHNNTQYSLDNEHFLSKRSFAFNVIKKIVDTHPEMTVKEIQGLIRQKSFITKKSDWETKSIDQKSRFCDKEEEEILTDANGEDFLVSDQWTQTRVETQIIPICQHFQWKVYRK